MKYQKTYSVRVFECDPSTKLSFSSLLNYMQDIAADHTVELKITIPELFKRGLTWMLSRYHISVSRYPAYMEKIIFKTWIAEHKGMFSIRDYSMETEDGEILALITSSWVLYDLKNKNIVNVEILDLGCYALPERAIDDHFSSLKTPEEIQHTIDLEIRKHDIDINRHANNRVIVEWALESLPLDFLNNHELIDLEITFKGQAFYGTTVTSASQINKDLEQSVCLHHITNSENGKSIAIARTHWITT